MSDRTPRHRVPQSTQARRAERQAGKGRSTAAAEGKDGALPKKNGEAATADQASKVRPIGARKAGRGEIAPEPAGEAAAPKAAPVHPQKSTAKGKHSDGKAAEAKPAESKPTKPA